MKAQPSERHHGIYLIPNLLTTASLFAAFYSIIASFKMQFETSVVAIFIGMLADGLDGRIARMTNTQTAFGAEYDSLSDMVTFGVAPAMLLYCWNLHDLGKIGWLIAFVYTAAVALRLARFNTQLEVADKRYFQGLACPSAAALLSSFVWFCVEQDFSYFAIQLITSGLSLLVSILMVSNIRYYSFKQIDKKGKIPFLYVLFIVILFVAVAAQPVFVLFPAFSLYVLSGPIQTIWAVRKMRKFRRELKRKKEGKDSSSR